jgi:predicted Fe-S protein YdhL (DUF1289 family)
VSAETTATALQGDAPIVSLIQQRTKLALSMAANLPSPCISLCQMNQQSGLCLGCFRTIDEICAWSALGDGGKREVWRLIEQRSAGA